jgi:hypothetical protein
MLQFLMIVMTGVTVQLIYPHFPGIAHDEEMEKEIIHLI